MKLVLLLALFVALATASSVEDASFLEVSAPSCFPDCKWKCDDPSCPAACEPQCEKPVCELRCEKLPPTKCDIRCEKPRCEVRCSRKNCQNSGCPLCENVCMPAKCQTVCTPSVPNCRPTCSPPKCTWSCKKPPTCPKPKCNLGCDARPKPACQKPKCCGCSSFINLESAVKMAHSAHEAEHGSPLHEDLTPAMVEVAHEVRFREQMEGQAQCCPCA